MGRVTKFVGLSALALSLLGVGKLQCDSFEKNLRSLGLPENVRIVNDYRFDFSSFASEIFPDNEMCSMLESRLEDTTQISSYLMELDSVIQEQGREKAVGFIDKHGLDVIHDEHYDSSIEALKERGVDLEESVEFLVYDSNYRFKNEDVTGMLASKIQTEKEFSTHYTQIRESLVRGEVEGARAMIEEKLETCLVLFLREIDNLSALQEVGHIANIRGVQFGDDSLITFQNDFYGRNSKDRCAVLDYLSDNFPGWSKDNLVFKHGGYNYFFLPGDSTDNMDLSEEIDVLFANKDLENLSVLREDIVDHMESRLARFRHGFSASWQFVDNYVALEEQAERIDKYLAMS